MAAAAAGNFRAAINSASAARVRGQWLAYRVGVSLERMGPFTRSQLETECVLDPRVEQSLLLESCLEQGLNPKGVSMSSLHSRSRV